MYIVPGALVIHPQQPDWGVGQVQSVIGSRATVNFEHAGKVVLNLDHVTLDLADYCESETKARSNAGQADEH